MQQILLRGCCTWTLSAGGNGSKRHLLVDGLGVPLSLVVSEANVHDGKRLDAVLSAIVIKRKYPLCRRNKHLCADAGYPLRSPRVLHSAGDDLMH
jgi:hypothetical protein